MMMSLHHCLLWVLIHGHQISGWAYCPSAQHQIWTEVDCWSPKHSISVNPSCRLKVNPQHLSGGEESIVMVQGAFTRQSLLPGQHRLVSQLCPSRTGAAGRPSRVTVRVQSAAQPSQRCAFCCSAWTPTYDAPHVVLWMAHISLLSVNCAVPIESAAAHACVVEYCCIEAAERLYASTNFSLLAEAAPQVGRGISAQMRWPVIARAYRLTPSRRAFQAFQATGMALDPPMLACSLAWKEEVRSYETEPFLCAVGTPLTPGHSGKPRLYAQ